MLTDTGFFCRNVLDMDTDKDDRGNPTSEVGKGGIRDSGPHQEMVAFLDDPSIEYGILMAPRYSYKSSAVQGFISRLLCAHPNISILLYMHEQDMAVQRCTQIRDSLLSNPIIKELYHDMQGPVWQAGRFITGIRTDKTLTTPSLFIGSPQKIPTGGRPNVIIFDDIVSDQNYKTELGRKKTVDCIERSIPLRSRGCRMIDVGTPYAPGDAHHWCLDQRGWKKLIHLDSGFSMVKKADGTKDVEGEARWPNLSKEFIRNQLKGGLTYRKFMSDYQLKVVSGFDEAFSRTHFQPKMWRDEFKDLTGYLLNDTAPSGDPKNDLNVLMYVGVDKEQRLYLLDCEVGYWQMYEFCERYLNMLDRWCGMVNHRKEIWEKGHTSYSYIQHLYATAKNNNGRRPSPVYETRSTNSANKDSRIGGLQVRFQSQQVYVMSTMPRHWNNGTEMRVLWDQAGYKDFDSEMRLPAGDLVDWFVQWPHHLKKDVPDCLSLVDILDKDTQRRVVFWTKPSHQRLTDTNERKVVPRGNGGAGSAARFYKHLGRRSNVFKRTPRTDGQAG